MTEHIKIEKSDGILSLTMARPDKKNALTNAMYGALADAIEGAETDPSVRVLLIRGEGDMFTAGNDVGEFAAIATGAVQGERHVSRFLQALARSSRPLVAAVQGRAVGVGTTMLLHCDLVVLAENALLSTPFVSLALVPEACLQPADAAPHRLCACLRDVRARRSRRCQRPRSPGGSPTAWCRSTSSMPRQGRWRRGWRNSRRAPSARQSG